MNLRDRLRDIIHRAMAPDDDPPWGVQSTMSIHPPTMTTTVLTSDFFVDSDPPFQLADLNRGTTMTTTPADDARYYPADDAVDVDLTDTGTHHLAEPLPGEGDARAVRVDCPTCGGHGYVTRTLNELLRESLALLADADGVVREFYRRLLDAAPDLAGLFPPDLLGEDTIRGQRDKLLHALMALAKMYNPADADGMKQLETALRSFGRSHAAFARPDGTTRGATPEEYLAVKTVLFGTLADAAGSAWLPAYTTAWSEAYDHAMIIMLHEQLTAGMTMPRYPRT